MFKDGLKSLLLYPVHNTYVFVVVVVKILTLMFNRFISIRVVQSEVEAVLSTKEAFFHYFLGLARGK